MQKKTDLGLRVEWIGAILNFSDSAEKTGSSRTVVYSTYNITKKNFIDVI
ncbi:hypothetical protein AWA2013_09710 [Lactiplantibacillus plantarum]|nr:hypothetical protein AWA2013_09710 [Lactiplantibacillus plantarum]